MARYPYRQQPQMVDTGDVPYVSYISEQAEPLMMQAAANAQQRYDLAQTLIAKYLEENAAAKFRDADYNIAMAKLNQDLENIKTIVKDRYDNQYGQAYPEISKGLSKARQTYHLAQKAYEEEQKYLPMYQKLKSEGKLVIPKGVPNPFEQSAFDESGNFKGLPDYSQMYERGDYEGWLQKNYSSAFQNELHQSLPNLSNETDPYLISKTVKGFGDNVIASKITKDDASKFLQDNKVFAIEHDLDPNKQSDIEQARQYMIKTIQGQVAEQVTYDINANQLWKQKQEANARAAAGIPKLIPLYSISTLGEKLDLSNVKLTDDTFQGEVKRELLNTLWKNTEGNVDPEKFKAYLSSYSKDDKVNLSKYIVNDENGNPDIYKTINNIEIEAGRLQSMGRSIGPAPLLNAMHNFLKGLDTYVDKKLSEKFGDYGVDVMGFDVDETSQEVKKRMDSYIETISPDLFNFETGKFADIKTRKLSDNKEFQKARADGKFKIQGVIKSPNGGVKYIAEDGSGEPQVVSSNDEMTNRNLLRLFGDPELIANYEYRDIKLSPSGNTVGYGDKKLKLPDGYTVEKESDGRYRLINKDKMKSRNTFEKWQILESFGINPSSFK